MRIRRQAAASAALLFLALFGSSPAARAQAPPLEVSPPTAASRWVPPTAPIVLQLSRPLGAAEGHIGILIDATDWTGLTQLANDRAALTPGTLLLPSGEHELTVYLVAPGNAWTELAHFRVRFLTPGGFELAEVKPAVEVANKGQVANHRSPAQAPLPRDTFQDFSVTAGLQTRTVRHGWNTSTQANVLASSLETERLRFSTKGASAPPLDLATYLVRSGNTRATFSLGAVTIAGEKHLAPQFASRGIQAALKPTPAVDVSLALVNGSAIVGWSNPFGIAEGDHQVRAATIGVDLRRSHPGDVRVAATLLDGALQPLAGFNQGVLNDAERSHGAGVQFAARDPEQRFRLDSGFARSRFENPADPLLNRASPVVAVRPTSRDARYVDIAYDVLHDVAVGRTEQRATLAAGYRFEQVDPLFRTVGAPIRGDVLQHVVEVNSRIGQAAAQASYTWLHDNLDEIASILTTQSRATAVNLAVPIASFFTRVQRRAAWIPTASYTLTRTHQYGEGLPSDSNFDSLSQVPDQVSTIQALGVDWQSLRWRAGYRLNGSLQDNRQAGRERSDFDNLNHAVTFGVTPDRRLDIAVDAAFEGAENRELARTDVTRRFGALVTARPAAKTTISGTALRTTFRDRPITAERHVVDLSLQLAQQIALRPGRHDAPSAQLFVRLARQTLFALEPVTRLASDQSVWTANTGVTVRIF